MPIAVSGFVFSVALADLSIRMRQRLAASETSTPQRIVWSKGGQNVLLHLDALTLRAADGWLMCNLEMETTPTGRRRLQFIFFLGAQDDGDGLMASATMNLPTREAAQLAERFGRDVQRLLWDAVLDGIEAAVVDAQGKANGKPIRLVGFHCRNNRLFVRTALREN